MSGSARSHTHTASVRTISEGGHARQLCTTRHVGGLPGSGRSRAALEVGSSGVSASKAASSASASVSASAPAARSSGTSVSSSLA